MKRTATEIRGRSGIAIIVATVLAVLGFAGCAHQQPTSLILISFDGFRWDYVDWPEAVNLQALAARGVRAEGLVPAFPSKTFPSHYTIVTGLHPGHHGIIANHMIDPAIGQFHLSDRDAVEDTRWWGGEPIWVTAEKADVVAAAMFWPGTEAEIAGVRPSHWHRWQSDFPYGDRVDQVLAWLDLPPPGRPRMITLYFQDPNDTSHTYGPEAPETRAAVREVDRRLGDLLAGIAARGLGDRVDLVVVSDHGMAEVDAARTIVLDDLVAFEPGEIFDQGALVQIVPNAGREALVYDALRGAHPHLAVYRRNEIPERFHLGTSPRLPPILAVPDVGWEAVTRAGGGHVLGGGLLGDHGQDPDDPRMHGIFVAAGPSFRRGMVIDRFHAVEIYNILARVLGLDPAPNDGDPTALADILAQRAP